MRISRSVAAERRATVQPWTSIQSFQGKWMGLPAKGKKSSGDAGVEGRFGRGWKEKEHGSSVGGDGVVRLGLTRSLLILTQALLGNVFLCKIHLWCGMRKKRVRQRFQALEPLEIRQLLTAVVQSLASLAPTSNSTQVQSVQQFRPTYEVFSANGMTPLQTSGPQDLTSEIRTAYGLSQVTFGGRPAMAPDKQSPSSTRTTIRQSKRTCTPLTRPSAWRIRRSTSCHRPAAPAYRPWIPPARATTTGKEKKRWTLNGIPCIARNDDSGRGHRFQSEQSVRRDQLGSSAGGRIGDVDEFRRQRNQQGDANMTSIFTTPAGHME